MSLIIGTVLGLTQSRIKKLLAYSTISHLGFILLALTINSLESIQAFIFYLMQYSFSNLNAFILLIAIGFSLYPYNCKDSLKQQYDNLREKNNSPLQLISQLKGYFYINPILALSLAITLFSFVGIPPLIGFFAKQMVLSAALDSGYVFLTLVAILTSVISAVYYLSIIKQMFFDDHQYELNQRLLSTKLKGVIVSSLHRPKRGVIVSSLHRTNKAYTNYISLNIINLKLSSSLSVTTSILTLTILLYIVVPEKLLSMTNILALTMFNP